MNHQRYWWLERVNMQRTAVGPFWIEGYGVNLVRFAFRVDMCVCVLVLYGPYTCHALVLLVSTLIVVSVSA